MKKDVPYIPNQRQTKWWQDNMANERNGWQQDKTDKKLAAKKGIKKK